jgi:hypothetical protein
MPPPSTDILERLYHLVDADDRTPRELSAAAGKYPVWLERRLAAGVQLNLADLDAILGALGVGVEAILCPPLTVPERDERGTFLD